MKKIIFLICILGMSVQIIYAQNPNPVSIEPIGQTETILIPANNIIVGNFNVIIPLGSYYLDSCWLIFSGVLPQVISNLKFNREDHPEYNPYTFWGSVQSNHLLTLGGIYNFPPVENDTTNIQFTADIGVNVLPPVGSTLFVSLQCLGFSLDHEEIVTNTAFGFPLVFEYDPNMSIGGVSNPNIQQSVVGKSGIIEINSNGRTVNIYSIQNQLLWSGSGVTSLSLQAGLYICEYDNLRKLIIVF